MFGEVVVYCFEEFWQGVLNFGAFHGAHVEDGEVGEAMGEDFAKEKVVGFAEFGFLGCDDGFVVYHGVEYAE